MGGNCLSWSVISNGCSHRLLLLVSVYGEDVIRAGGRDAGTGDEEEIMDKADRLEQSCVDSTEEGAGGGGVEVGVTAPAPATCAALVSVDDFGSRKRNWVNK